MVEPSALWNRAFFVGGTVVLLRLRRRFSVWNAGIERESELWIPEPLARDEAGLGGDGSVELYRGEFNG